MNDSTPQYISVSRRTDIPRFYYEEFYAAWQKGTITYDSGYGRSYTVSLRAHDVLGYIFWSKDFAPFITHPLFRKLNNSNNSIFHFTINDCPTLEPNVAPLAERLETLARLCDLVGPVRVLWRFDPVCKYKRQDGQITTNGEAFYRILPLVAHLGVRRCYFSFMTQYAKLNNRRVRFHDFSIQEKTTISRQMLHAASEAQVALYNCCNQDILESVPGINKAHCVEDKLLAATDRFGVHRRLKSKATRSGCGCHESRDIGSYLQKCKHRCHYCYANPETNY